MSRLIYDLESNGLLDTVSVVHCLVIKDYDTKERASYYGSRIEEGVRRLEKAELTIGHNIIGYDAIVLKRLYNYKPTGKVFDTLVGAQMYSPDQKRKDFDLWKKGLLPGQLMGRHSLEAWGYRLGNYKGDFKGPWDVFTEEMLVYCEQDVEVTFSLYDLLVKSVHSTESFDLEMAVTQILQRQEAYGFPFDEGAAASLYAELCARREKVADQLAGAFPPLQRSKEFIPKRNNKTRGYEAGVPFTKRWEEAFNPGSRDHIVESLQIKYQWEPAEFTDKDNPKMDEEVLERLPYPEAPLLCEYFMVNKRIGQLAEGKEAWLKHVGKDGRIHGRVQSVGAVTSRMAHSKPNMAQVPNSGSEYGPECRDLFTAPPGMMIVGADAAALEARCLAHYMAFYDHGAYTDVVLNGDIHSVNQKAAGLATRNLAKTFFYGFIYGAGDYKLGTFVTKPGALNQLVVNAGKRLRAKFLKGLPAMKKLMEAVQAKVKRCGQLKGLDGRILYVRSSHSALNLLLQSCGAILMKRALVILDERLQSDLGLVPGVDYEFMANVHDEWQIAVCPAWAEEVGKAAVAAITSAGDYYNLQCPLTGEYKIGKTWAETH